MADRTTLDLDFVRAQFPALDQGWAYFENAGGSLVARPVIERLSEFASNTRVQPGYPYAPSARAAEILAENERLMTAMINAEPEEVLIGPSTTMNVYVLSHALAPLFSPGDEVIVTNLDHEANNGAWRRLAEHGISVKEWQINPETADLEIETLESLLGERTRLVCVTQCSNVVGSINDIATITRKVHDAGAWICTDAVSYAPHRRLDVKALDVDFYLFSLYKVYGPHLAILYGKRERLLEARSQNHYFFAEDNIPGKFKLGGHQFEASGALGGLIEYFDALYAHHFETPEDDLHTRLGRVFELIAKHEQALATRFLDFVGAKQEIRLVGRNTPASAARAPTFSFSVEGRASASIPPALVGAKVGLNSGDFYGLRCIEALGYDAADGVVRASMVHYNSEGDVERLIAALDEAI